VFGPIVVNWYQLLNRLQFTSPMKAVVYRTFLDQAVFSPRMYLFDYETSTSLIYFCSHDYALLHEHVYHGRTRAGGCTAEAQRGQAVLGARIYECNSSTLNCYQAYSETLLRNWAVFGPAQVVNFAVVPHHLRVLSIGVVSLFWSTFSPSSLSICS
jgi:protein Mpv17